MKLYSLEREKGKDALARYAQRYFVIDMWIVPRKVMQR